MATKKFKTDSLYKQKHVVPTEDYIYNKHVRDFEMQENNSSNTIGLAIFGIGRAGTIHLTSLIRNPRVKLLYIVEDDKKKWNSLRSYWSISTEVKFLTFQDADQVYEDINSM